MSLINPLLVPIAYAQELTGTDDPVVEAEQESVSETAEFGSEEESVSDPEQAGDSEEGNDSEESDQGIESDQETESESVGATSPDQSEANSESDQDQIISGGVSEEDDSEADLPETAINTGDANSQSAIDNIINQNEATVSGTISSPEDNCAPPIGETDCPDGVEVDNDNFADVDNQATSSADTGENSVSGTDGNAEIDTGDAAAGADIDNQLNTNTTVFDPDESVGDGGTAPEDPEPETSGTGEEETEEESSEDQSSVVVVDNQNDSFVVNDVGVTAETGQNQADDNAGNATVKTGDALAYANLINFLNTNIVGSDFGIYLLNLTEGSQETINLDLWWQKILEQSQNGGLSLLSGEDFDLFRIINDNLAAIDNDVNVSADTGGNSASGNSGAAEVGTGDAAALANVVNFANLNLTGSKFFLPVINIFDSFSGNIILPRPEKFIFDSGLLLSQGPDVVFENQNSGQVESQVGSLATTGGNSANNNQSGSLIDTGNAESRSNSLSFVNTDLYGNNWFFLSLNILGSWLGQVLGWTAPNSTETVSGNGPMIFELSQTQTIIEEGNGQEPSLPGGDDSTAEITNINSADIKNNVQTSANTGGNSADNNGQDASVKTGEAKALSNLVNFINTNVWGSHWFFGLVNILGNWKGNVIFAYPDLTISLSGQPGPIEAGTEAEYIVYYRNKGYDSAKNVVIELELPVESDYLLDNSGLPVEIDDRHCRWSLAQVGAGEEGSFTVTVMVGADFSGDQPNAEISLFSKLFTVYAAEGEEFRIVLSAAIGTADPESDLSNNNSFAITDVYRTIAETDDQESNQSSAEEEQIGDSGGQDHRQPVLEISAQNNVNGFVYLGDTVSFEIIVKNISDVPSYDTVVTHALYNGDPEDFGIGEFYLGTVKPGERVVLRFGMYLMNNGTLKPSHYRTVTQAFGYAQDDNEVASDRVLTYFEIRLRNLIPVFKVEAKEEDPGDILGDFYCNLEEDLLPYLLVFLLSSLGLIEKSRRALAIKKRVDGKKK